jgi:hypothetical protein
MHSVNKTLNNSKTKMEPKKTLMMAIENMSSPRISHNGSRESSAENNNLQFKFNNAHLLENSINSHEFRGVST